MADPGALPPPRADVSRCAAEPVPRCGSPGGARVPERCRPATRITSIQLGVLDVLVPSGEFAMGCEALEAAPNEKPLTRGDLSRFFLSRFPSQTPNTSSSIPLMRENARPGAGDRHPVVYVSSLDAMKFCEWLRPRERKRYRLPTEAEWEYAARGPMAGDIHGEIMRPRRSGEFCR